MVNISRCSYSHKPLICNSGPLINRNLTDPKQNVSQRTGGSSFITSYNSCSDFNSTLYNSSTNNFTSDNAYKLVTASFNSSYSNLTTFKSETSLVTFPNFTLSLFNLSHLTVHNWSEARSNSTHQILSNPNVTLYNSSISRVNVHNSSYFQFFNSTETAENSNTTFTLSHVFNSTSRHSSQLSNTLSNS